jgi:hypothetical protein
MNTTYIYNGNLELVGIADRNRLDESIFGQYYIDSGFIISTSKMDFNEDEGLEVI